MPSFPAMSLEAASTASGLSYLLESMVSVCIIVLGCIEVTLLEAPSGLSGAAWYV